MLYGFSQKWPIKLENQSILKFSYISIFQGAGCANSATEEVVANSLPANIAKCLANDNAVIIYYIMNIND